MKVFHFAFEPQPGRIYHQMQDVLPLAYSPKTFWVFSILSFSLGQSKSSRRSRAKNNIATSHVTSLDLDFYYTLVNPIPCLVKAFPIVIILSTACCRSR